MATSIEFNSIGISCQVTYNVSLVFLISSLCTPNLMLILMEAVRKIS